MIIDKPSLIQFNERFRWMRDVGLDSWRVLKPRLNGWYFGDCDDYALTVLWIMAGHSKLRMALWLITFKAVFWQVKSPGGEQHIILWIRGKGWIDNIYPHWRERPYFHQKLFPWLWIFIPMKLFTNLVNKVFS